MSLERQNRPTLPPDQRIGCLGAIAMLPRITIVAIKDKRHEYLHRRSDRELFLGKLSGARSRNEAFTIASSFPDDIVSLVSDQLEAMPVSERIRLADAVEAASARLFDNFRTSGSDSYRVRGEILLRISNQIRVQTESDQNPRQDS